VDSEPGGAFLAVNVNKVSGGHWVIESAV